MQRTFSIIKPKAVSNHHIGHIIAIFEEHNLRIAGIKLITLNREKAKIFYAEHDGKPFFNDLLDFITSGPIVLMVLEGLDAIKLNRKIMGVTNPQEAETGTIRNLYAESIQANAVHGSDSEQAAKREIALFFDDSEIVKS